MLEAKQNNSQLLARLVSIPFFLYLFFTYKCHRLQVLKNHLLSSSSTPSQQISSNTSSIENKNEPYD